MTSDSLSSPTALSPTPATHRWHVRHFARHYAEMVVAMFAGMLVLGGIRMLILSGTALRADVATLLMATDMALGMGAWMWFRGHSWRGVAEMSASMYLPFVVLLVPFWAGGVDADSMMLWGHVLMLPAMAVVMLLRPEEYAHRPSRRETAPRGR